MAQYSSAVLWFGVLDCRLLERIVFRSLFSLHRHLRLSSKQRPFWEHCWHFPALWCLCLSNQGLTQASPSSKKPLPASSAEGYCAPCYCITSASLLVHHLSLLKIASFPFFSVAGTVFEDSSETLFLPVCTYTMLHFPCILSTPKLFSLKSACTVWLYKGPLLWISYL